jgi:hypothetical protein
MPWEATSCVLQSAQVQAPGLSEGLEALRTLEKDFGVLDAIISSLEVHPTSQNSPIIIPLIQISPS